MKTPRFSDHAIAILDAVCSSSEPPPASNFLRAHAYRLAELGLINIISGKAYPTVDGFGVNAELERRAFA